jgi:hypothetical protein
MKLGMYIKAPEPINHCIDMCILNIFARQRLCKNFYIVARQRLDISVIAATNAKKTVEELCRI